MKTILLLLCLFCLSCTHKISLVAVGCGSTGQWATDGAGEREVLVEHKFWSTPRATNLQLSSLLAAKKLSCQSLDELVVEFKTDQVDALWSLLPFVKRQTLILKGYALSSTTEEISAKDGH